MPDEPIRVIIENSQHSFWWESPIAISVSAILATGIVALLVPMYQSRIAKRTKKRSRKLSVYCNTVRLLSQIEHYNIATNEFLYSQKYLFQGKRDAKTDFDKQTIVQELFITRERHDRSRIKRIELKSELYQQIAEYEILIGKADEEMKRNVELIFHDKVFKLTDKPTRDEVEAIIDVCHESAKTEVKPKMDAIKTRMKEKLAI